MSEFKHGDKVDITITGATVVRTSANFIHVVHGTYGEYQTVSVNGTDSPAVNVVRVAPEYTNNTLWTDKGGHLWLVQYEPVADDDNDEVHFYSSLGDCTREEAERWYGPFTRCVVQPDAEAA